MICSHCHSDNPAPNQYCGTCGAKLSGEAAMQGEDPVFSAIVSTAPIFSEKELRALIEINRAVTSSESKNSSVIQSDIDKLFE